jgi:hypothetical protein
VAEGGYFQSPVNYPFGTILNNSKLNGWQAEVLISRRLYKTIGLQTGLKTIKVGYEHYYFDTIKDSQGGVLDVYRYIHASQYIYIGIPIKVFVRVNSAKKWFGDLSAGADLFVLGNSPSYGSIIKPEKKINLSGSASIYRKINQISVGVKLSGNYFLDASEYSYYEGRHSLYFSSIGIGLEGIYTFK